MTPSRPRSRVAAVAAALAVVAIVAGCGGSSPASSTPPIGTPTPPPAAPTPVPSATPTPTDAPSPAAAGPLLEVTTEGGFINPVVTLSALPAVVVEADGRIYTPGIAAADGSLVPPVDVRDVGPAGATAILDAIRAAGLDRQEPAGGVAADTGTTVFTAVVDGEPVVNRFAASGPGGPGRPGGNGGASQDPAAAAAFDLLARLADPAVAWGGSTPAAAPYTPVAYRIYAAPADPGADAGPAWPLASGLDAFGRPAVPDLGIPGLRTGVVTGADAATLRPVLEAAAPGAVFTGGGTWTVWVRPLLPSELGG
jgi:hypothetical protein